MEYRFGEISVEDKEEGRQIHEELLRMKPATLKELIKNIEENPVHVCRFPVYAELEGLVIVGVPDAIVFRYAKPVQLFELKTTTSSLDKLWADERVQVEACAYALDYMGFNCSDLRLVVIKVKRSKKEEMFPKDLLRAIVQEICLTGRDLNSIGKLGRVVGAFRIHVLSYNRQSISREVAVDQGLLADEKGGPIPTKREGKCRACAYNDKCPYSSVGS